MPIRVQQQSDATGVAYVVETDTDSGVEIRRSRVPLDQQPLKSRLEALLDESANDLMRLQYRIDHVADYGLGPAAQNVLLNALNARKTAALSRDLTLLTAWRNA
jgi:hypothetical protein